MRLAVSAQADDCQPALELSQRLELPMLPAGTSIPLCADFDAILLVGEGGLMVQRTGAGAPGPVGVDFGSAGMRHRRGAGHNELLGRAVGVGRKPELHLLDATAGLGRDAFVLADLGCMVLMCERLPVAAALLESGLVNGLAAGDPWLQGVVGRMRLWQGDARALPAPEIVNSDVIYLDPMFPARSKQAAVKKEMALFQWLLADSSDDGVALLDWSLQQDVARVVVKRPLKAGDLGGHKPSHAIAGRAVRYDVYVRGKLG